jgi:hypothetical protein
VVAHPLDFFDVSQPKFMAHILRHASSRLTDQQVHQLESFRPRRVLDVDAPRHLGGQHGFGLVKGAVSRDLRGLYHKSHD